ncbi:MAG: pyridoxal phosphate-dependent aminotransferase [Candidatus Thorarchaeota archaeon]|jgi:aminotransferase
MLADRNNEIITSEIRKMYRMAEGRENVLNMSVGLPDFDTPQNIKDAAKAAIDEGFTKYTANAGFIDVRESLAKKLKRDNNIDADPQTEIICTAGGMGALLLANLVIVNPGDEVIYPDPGFVSHYSHIKLAGGVPVPVQLKREHNFEMQAKDVEKLITPKTKMLVINSPNNPTGGVIRRHQMEKIAELAIQNDIFVLSDEAYEKFYYGEEKLSFIGSMSGMEDRSISLFSFSKSYAMTGWRIGFAKAPPNVFAEMIKLQEHVLAMPTSISQKAAKAAVDGPQKSVREMLSTFAKRRSILVKGFNDIEGMNLDFPTGAFYAFPDVSEYKKKTWDLAVELVQKTGVIAVHGSGFGKYGEGFLRFCYAVSTEVIEDTISRLDSYLPKLLD